MDYFNEDFLSMDDQSETVSGLFCSDTTIVDGVMERLTKEANETHRAECSHDDKCRGTLPYMMAALKRYLLYNELTEMERLAIVSLVMYSLGVRGGEERMQERAISAKIPSFAEFVARMNKGENPFEIMKR